MEPEILLGEFDTLLLDNSGGQAGKAILYLDYYLNVLVFFSLVFSCPWIFFLLFNLRNFVHYAPSSISHPSPPNKSYFIS